MSQALPTFEAELWRWEGTSAWYFVTLPAELTDQVTTHRFLAPRGCGTVRVQVASGDVVWDTSVFPSRQTGAFILPVKAAIRRKLGVAAGDRLTLKLTLTDQAMI